jgi:thiol-disulfide isomerase/thioredoxin
MAYHKAYISGSSGHIITAKMIFSSEIRVAMFDFSRLRQFFLANLFVIISSQGALANTLSDPMAELEQQINAASGQVVYLDFWASWCIPCRKSFPWLNQMQAKYGEQGLTVLSVNLDADQALAKEFLSEVPADFSVIYDPNGSIARQFKLKGMPTSYIFNGKGEIVTTHVGFKVKKIPEYEQELVKLLANRASK